MPEIYFENVRFLYKNIIFFNFPLLCIYISIDNQKLFYPLKEVQYFSQRLSWSFWILVISPIYSGQLFRNKKGSVFKRECRLDNFYIVFDRLGISQSDFNVSCWFFLTRFCKICQKNLRNLKFQFLMQFTKLIKNKLFFIFLFFAYLHALY